MSDGVGVMSLCSGEGENMFAMARADRPPGNDWIFSFWFSMISKSMRSSETDILSGVWRVVVVNCREVGEELCGRARSQVVNTNKAVARTTAAPFSCMAHVQIRFLTAIAKIWGSCASGDLFPGLG